jgi:hypothetical protein
MSAVQIREHAERLEQIAVAMQELLAEAGTLVHEIDALGEDVGANLHKEFDNYIQPHIQIRLGEDGGGYATHDKGLMDLVTSANDYADELGAMAVEEA